jgi:hypothetical protein
MSKGISLEDRKQELRKNWGRILVNADNDTLDYFFRVLPLDLSVMVKFIKEFRPLDVNQAIKMYTIILNCSDFDFQSNGYPATLEDLLIAWKRSDTAFESPTFCKSLVTCLKMSLMELVGSFYPHSDDDYCLLIYHLQKIGLYQLNYDGIVGKVLDLVGFGFNLNRLAVCSGGLSEQRLLEILLQANDYLSREEKICLERIIDCPQVKDEKRILSRPRIGNTLDQEKTPPPYELLELVTGNVFVPAEA